jgi:hypothetical protein
MELIIKNIELNFMSRLFTFITLLLSLMSLSKTLHAQKDVTKFLTIPVDGYKSDMVKKLKDKGYISSPLEKDVLEGVFNGKKVKLHVVTDNNKVSRIMVSYSNSMSETEVKIEFNNLCKQFVNNKKYTSFVDYEIPEEEDISYEITVKNKRFEASFYQLPETVDSNAIYNEIETFLLTKYSKEQLNSPTEELKQEMFEIWTSYFMEKYSKKSVWFMIKERFGEYFITMFYDNEYNRPSGDDL